MSEVVQEAGGESVSEQPVEEVVSTEEEVPASEPLSEGELLALEGETAADYLEELMDIIDMDGDIDTFVEAGRPHVSILTQGNQLVGADGAVLEALQELSRLAVLTKLSRHSRLMLDIAGHREKRKAEIGEIVATAVAELRSTGEPVSLPAMNPFERKIVHDAVAAEGLYSESEGQDAKRHVVIRAAK